MAAHRLDAIARALAASTTRRTLGRRAGLALVAALGAAAGLGAEGAAAAKKARCRKLGASCSPKQKCCKGTVCAGKRCACPTGKKRCGTTCLNQGDCCADTEKRCGNACIRKSQCCADADCTGLCNTCVDHVCVPKAAGTSCGFRGIRACNSGGDCVERLCTPESGCAALDEAIRHEDYCYESRCENGLCKAVELGDFSFLPSRFQEDGDCGQYWCYPGIPDGRTYSDDRQTWDPPAPTDCATATCSGPGVINRHPEPAGKPCGNGSAGRCDGEGVCVES